MLLQIMYSSLRDSNFFFFNHTATTEIYTLSLHDALPILDHLGVALHERVAQMEHLAVERERLDGPARGVERSEEHTSELQSRRDLVCRLLLEKKKHNQHDRAV